MNYEEKTLDCLILGMLRQDPSCDLTYMSEELKLPKTEIMKHIRYLCDNDFLTLNNNRFYTTTHGDRIAIHPQSVSRYEHLNTDAPTTVNFDWEECSYLPTPKSFLAKKKIV